MTKSEGSAEFIPQQVARCVVGCVDHSLLTTTFVHSFPSGVHVSRFLTVGVLAFGSFLSLASAPASAQSEPRYRVTVTNLTKGQT